ncbi:MA3-domain-containing protein [Coccomyxa subellipsoidea C-169]|uniref:MA3-domain-containing protein n=1 Tax=Coccomyxa subellipsoidea (strain C-169) TaxID=574566 RepID=I0YIU3_COCSC|nr:MA3-domain-containing protein [Coccomyxa subellipsoidea C-169]EIE18312.1 MA3-domain-containing protein [Coccomyxa subellipsoidea C-169]|eukprot:XP_005642856.1 MA3-domain-containing protein [Coccomyxa subellipsoidea C-169]
MEQHMTSVQSQQVKQYKQSVEALIDEYFNSGDLQEASTRLQELDEPEYNHFFVKKVVTRALDKHNHEREMASILLSALLGEVISAAQMAKGFRRLLDAAADLRLDVPEAPHQIAAFIARAVADNVLPPAFVEDIPADELDDVGVVKVRSGELLREPGAGERLANIWGSGAGLVLEETHAAMGRLLKEYVRSGDSAEVEKGLRALAVPFFHHEFVRQAVVIALHNTPKQDSILQLLGGFAESGFLSTTQLVRGFQRVADNLERDVASTREKFEAIVAAGCAGGWLERGFEEGYLGAHGRTNGTAPTPEAKAFKQGVIGIAREYFLSADTEEVATALSELAKPEMHHIFVKQAILLALDRRDREREMVSVLLAALNPKTVSEDSIAQGFTDLMLACEDLELDLPDATHYIALFLGRAIVDEVLPPAFLTTVLARMNDDSLGVHIVRSAGNMLGARHAAERLQRCWATPFAFSIDHLRHSFQALLKEYVVSGVYAEAAGCLRALDAPHYHHEFVKRALLAAFEAPEQAPALMSLLATLTETGQVSQTQVDTGFQRVEGDLDDIDLDYPNAKKLFADYKAQATESGWLSPAAA